MGLGSCWVRDDKGAGLSALGPTLTAQQLWVSGHPQTAPIAHLLAGKQPFVHTTPTAGRSCSAGGARISSSTSEHALSLVQHIWAQPGVESRGSSSVQHPWLGLVLAAEGGDGSSCGSMLSRPLLGPVFNSMAAPTWAFGGDLVRTPEGWGCRSW